MGVALRSMSYVVRVLLTAFLLITVMVPGRTNASPSYPVVTQVEGDFAN